MAKVNVSQSATAGPVLSEPELRMEFAAPMYAAYCGTREQLIELGIVSGEQVFPLKTRRANWRKGPVSYDLKRKRLPGATGAWANSDYWKVSVRDDRYTWEDVEEHQLRAKRASANFHVGRDLERFADKAIAAKYDLKFQAMLATVCG